ncbi:2B14 protein, partial [Turnix velox]|nr:2B14 protein [Turnix velox]
PPDVLLGQTGFFMNGFKFECHFLNGTERVRYVEKYFYNREQFIHFDSDVGYHVADNPLGEDWAKYWNSQPDLMEDDRARVDTLCRHNYGIDRPFSVDR